MVLPAVLILLIVLVIANFLLAITNKISPPCNTVEDFFSNAKSVKQVSDLETIKTKPSKYFYGLFDPKNGKKIESEPELNYMQNTVESYINPVVQAITEDESDCVTRSKRDQLGGIRFKHDVGIISDEATTALNELFPTKTLDKNIRSTVDSRGSILDFDVTTEDMQNTNTQKPKESSIGARQELSRQTHTEGYQSI